MNNHGQKRLLDNDQSENRNQRRRTDRNVLRQMHEDAILLDEIISANVPQNQNFQQTPFASAVYQGLNLHDDVATRSQAQNQNQHQVEPLSATHQMIQTIMNIPNAVDQVQSSQINAAVPQNSLVEEHLPIPAVHPMFQAILNSANTAEQIEYLDPAIEQLFGPVSAPPPPPVSGNQSLPETGADFREIAPAIPDKIYLDYYELEQQNPYLWRDPKTRKSVTLAAEKRDLNEMLAKYAHKRVPSEEILKHGSFKHIRPRWLRTLLRSFTDEPPLPFSLSEDIELVQELSNPENPGFLRFMTSRKLNLRISELYVKWKERRTKFSIFNRAQFLRRLFARLRQIYGLDTSSDPMQSVVPLSIPTRNQHLNNDARTLNQLREVGECYGSQGYSLLCAQYDKTLIQQKYQPRELPVMDYLFVADSVPYCTEEDVRLIEWHRKVPNNWEIIAKHLPYRIPKSVEKRFRELQRAYDVLHGLKHLEASRPNQSAQPGPSNSNNLV